MSFLQRLLGRSIDQPRVVRISRHSFRKSWWRRSGRAWLLLMLLIALMGAILLLLQPAQAFETMIAAASDERPISP